MRLALTTDDRRFLREDVVVLTTDAGQAVPAATLLADAADGFDDGAARPGDMASLIERWSVLDTARRRELGAALERSANRSLAVPGLRAPIDPHAKILVVTGRRYAAAPLDRAAPIAAMMKYPSACADPGQAIVLPRAGGRFEVDAAIGIVIGTPSTYVPRDQARSRIAGYTLLLDVWDREAYEEEARTNNGLLAKNHARLSPIGPSIWLPDEPSSVALPAIRLLVNGVERQSFTLDQLTWPIEDAIAHWSSGTLNSGDIVAFGAALVDTAAFPAMPPVPIAAGDRLSLSCGPIGTLESEIVAAREDRP